MYLLDTNVISETRRPVRMHRNVKAWLEQTSPESLYTSVIVMMELERGVLGMERKDPAQGAILREWLEQVIKPAFNGRILPIDEATAGICARLHIPDRRPYNDALIAASTIRHGLTLVTRNTRDFADLQVPLFNPFGEI